MRVYLDNAATTPVDPEVFEEMKPWFTNSFGNPSSLHSFGREAKSAVELARKKIASLINVSPGEVYFTSGGTESINTTLSGAVHAGYKKIITSPIEHHAVLKTLEHFELKKQANVQFVDLLADGSIDFDSLKTLLRENPRSLVSLMHANNEVGNMIDLEQTGELIQEYEGYFHSDTVQTMGHFRHDFSKLHIHAAVCSAHKIHGPKGIGFMYLNKNLKLESLIKGGSQERNMRAGTENVASIVGLAKAFELAHERMDHDRQYITSLKTRMIEGLKENVPGILFNGRGREEDSLYTVLSVGFPPEYGNEFVLFNLDMKGVAVSGGSACSSGASKRSHVLASLELPPRYAGVRFSFSRMNTIEEIDFALQAIKEI